MKNISRRECIKGVAFGGAALLAGRGLAVAGTAAASTSRPAAESGPVAETLYGKVRGSSTKGIQIFRGIPYGGSADGAGRFMPPTRPVKWPGIRDANVFTVDPISVQSPINLATDQLIGKYFLGGRPDSLELSKQALNENCLVLNVLTPELKGKRPVMVYIHGGGVHVGSGLLTIYGDGLVREQNVVLVGINHRLNVFGYLYLGELRKSML
jgi:para-nitrobenzyl esterase